MGSAVGTGGNVNLVWNNDDGGSSVGHAHAAIELIGVVPSADCSGGGTETLTFIAGESNGYGDIPTGNFGTIGGEIGPLATVCGESGDPDCAGLSLSSSSDLSVSASGMCKNAGETIGIAFRQTTTYFELSFTGSFTIASIDGTLSAPTGTISSSPATFIGNFDGFVLENAGGGSFCVTGGVVGCPGYVHSASTAAIPTLSQWSLIILALLLMTAGTLYLVQPMVRGAELQKKS
ncbi:MAG: hypothetical protein R3E32_10330 [Chitinophagales bacterium]